MSDTPYEMDEARKLTNETVDYTRVEATVAALAAAQSRVKELEAHQDELGRRAHVLLKEEIDRAAEFEAERDAARAAATANAEILATWSAESAEREAALSARSARLEAALRPFAERAERLDGYKGAAPDHLVALGITAEQCIAARAALAASPVEPDGYAMRVAVAAWDAGYAYSATELVGMDDPNERRAHHCAAIVRGVK